MYHHYAQIDENGYIVGISHLSGEMISTNLIQIDVDFDPTNKKWNGSGWETYEPPEPPEPEPTQPTQLDRIEELAKAKNADIAQSAIDSYTIELIERGLL